MDSVREGQNLILHSCLEVKDLQKKHTGDLLINLYSQVQPDGMVYEDNGLSVIPWTDSYAANSKVAVDWLQKESSQEALVQPLDSEMQAVAFGEQDHYGVKALVD